MVAVVLGGSVSSSSLSGRTAMRWTTRLHILLTIIGMGLLAACGSSAPTAEPPSTAEPAGAEDGATTEQGDQPTTAASATPAEAAGELAAVQSELEGLEGQERTDRLVELAQEGGGTVQWYTSMTDQLAQQMADDFEQTTGVQVQLYRAPSAQILQLILQEATAGVGGADVVEFSGPEIVALAKEGALVPYDSPALAELIEGADHGDWTTSRLNVFAPAWNTELADQPPTTWEGLADPRWDGRLGMERTNAEWYMALSNYWTEEAGKSPEEVQQLWEDIVQGSLMVQGHSPLRQLLISGEFAAVPSLYSYMVEESQGNGAPLEWQPPVEPLIVGPNGTAVIVNTPNPAGAMLFTDWLLTDGQQHIADAGIESVQTDLQQLGDVETYAIDVEKFSDEQEQWMSELERLTGLGEAAPQS